MIIATTGEDYASLLLGHAPRDFALADTAIAPPDVLQMLADVAERVRARFSPASWLLVQDGEVTGLCSITRAPEGRVIDIGYGIAPSRHNRGIATRAIGEIVAWARQDPRVDAITADTSPANIASQQVLLRNGFVQIGDRIDAEDGHVLCWRRDTA